MSQTADSRLFVLRGLYGQGPVNIAIVQADYERRLGLDWPRASAAFDVLVDGLIHDGLVDRRAEPDPKGGPPIRRTLWITPKGEEVVRNAIRPHA